LEVIVSFVGFLLAFLVVKRLWVRGVFECSPELVALLSGVVTLQMRRALFFQEVFEAARGLFDLSFAGRWIAATVLSGLRLRLGPE
jgi:hypothetical protein